MSRKGTKHAFGAELLEPRTLLSAIPVTTLQDSGAGSLRTAIATANSSPGADAINFVPALSGTITLTSGQLEISGDLTIGAAPGQTIAVDGNGSSRVFQIDSGTAVTLQRLTIQNGKAADSVSPPVLTPGQSGGGILNLGSLTLVQCVVTNNHAGNGLSFSFNGPGTAGGDGGGIASSGFLDLEQTTVEANRAGDGGNGNATAGIGGAGGAGGNGGGVFSSGFVLIHNSTFAQNAAGNGGAGAFAGLIAGNGGSGGNGGGLYLGGTGAQVLNMTVSGNHAGAGGAAGASPGGPGTPGPAGLGGGAAQTGGAAIAIANSILAANTGPGAPDVFGGFGSAGHNLVGTTAGSSGWAASDLSGSAASPLDPRLGTLGNYGGPTPTFPLLARSPALDHGDNSLVQLANLTTDQRGLARIFNGVVDIGAFEAQPAPPPGDVNHDGTVNFTDLLLLAQEYGANNVPVWESGDLNGDGTVNFTDLLLLAQNYGRVASPIPAGNPLLLRIPR